MPSLNMGQFKQGTVFVDQDGFLTFNPKSETGENNSQVGFIHVVDYNYNTYGFSTVEANPCVDLDLHLTITSPVSVYDDLSDEDAIWAVEGTMTEAEYLKQEYQKQKINKKVVKLSDITCGFPGPYKPEKIQKKNRKPKEKKQEDIKAKPYSFLDLDD